MSWQPPPSFTPGKDKGQATEAKKSSALRSGNSPKAPSKSTTWAPSFVVGQSPVDSSGLHDQDGEFLAPPPPLRVGNTKHAGHMPSEVKRHFADAPSKFLPSTTTEFRNESGNGGDQPALVGLQPLAKRGTVNWGDVSQLSVEEEKDNGYNNIPSREALGFAPIIARKETIIVDRAILQTRLEWTQLLLNKALRPYAQQICAVDDDLPDPESLPEYDEEDDLLEMDPQLGKIRDGMLDDPDLSEREIAAFFEGFKLFQMKVNSLQSQLESLKSAQRTNFHSIHQALVGSSSERNLARARSLVTTPAALTRRVPSMPPISSSPARIPSSSASSTRSRQDDDDTSQPVVTKKEKAAPEQAPSKTSLSDAPPPRRVSDGPRLLQPTKSLRAMSIVRIREQTEQSDDPGSKDIRKLLEELEEAEKRQKKLEKQLAQAGVVIAEDIPYDVAKGKVASIAARMEEIGSSDNPDPKLREEYFKLEQEMEKYTTALTLTDEWQEEQEEQERAWEESVEADNEEAIRKVRRHMPVDVRNMSEAALSTQPTPNGEFLPRATAKKFKRTNVLQILRTDPQDIVPMHPSTLENMRVTGLTLTERRAIYHHLKDVGPRWKSMQAEKMTERKWTWYNMMRSNFKENVEAWQRHVDQYGPPGNHPYATRDNPNEGCPLIGKQCPLKADKAIDYDGDYGFPEGPEYFKSEVKKSEVDNVDKAKQEAQELARGKKAKERSEALKKHYKGKILQVSLANGSCEAMDDAMDKMEDAQERWIKARLLSKGPPTDEAKKKEGASFSDALNEQKLAILQVAERSGMQLTGKRDANADQPDIRSMVEVALCEEVIEAAEDFFGGIEDRMAEIEMRDGRMNSTIHQLRQLFDELHERNLRTLEALEQERPARSRKLKSRAVITEEVKKQLASEEGAKEEEPAAAPRGPPGGMPGRGGGGRGDLLGALQGRGRGGGREVDGGGRGDLLSALAGRGRGGGGRGRGTVPGGLMPLPHVGMGVADAGTKASNA